MVAGRDAATFGEAKNSWLTGTAAWTFVDVSQYILGIQPTLAGLKIDPCIPHEMDGFTLRRVWRGATYEIVVENPDHLEKGVKAMTVDGKPVSGNILSPVPAGSTVERSRSSWADRPPFTAKQQPAVGCCFFCTVFIHRRAASRTRKLPYPAARAAE